MSMTSIDVSKGDRLELEPTRNALRLWPAVGGARMELRLRVTRSAERTPPPRYRLSAALHVGRSPQQVRRLVTRLDTDSLVAPGLRGFEISFAGFVSDQQLRLINELREGKELWFILVLDVTAVEGEPPELVASRGELSFAVSPGEWGSEMDRVDSVAFIELLIPMPEGAEDASQVRLLREAQQLIRDNKVDAGLVRARKALEPMIADIRDSGIVKTARDKTARDRTLDERFAILAEDTIAVLHGAAHEDPVTADFHYTRADATLLLATTAGLVSRHIRRQ